MMTRRLAIAPVFMALLGGVLGCEQPSPEISSIIAEPLGEGVSLHLKGIDYKVEGTTIEVGGHRLEVSPYEERCRVRESQRRCWVRFDIHANGALDERLTFVVVGDGATREAAQRSAVQHWWLAFAFPLIRSIADDQTDFTQSAYAAYPGAMVVRGKRPGGWIDGSIEMHQKLTAVLTAVVGGKPVVKSIDLTVSVDEDGRVTGECRVNGILSQDILAVLRKLDWPKSDSRYTFHQTYILKHVRES